MNRMQARQIIVTGRVQGVGFRPFVYRLAHEFGLTGWVLNRSGTVEIRAEGEESALTAFIEALIRRPPPLARPDLPQVKPVLPAGLKDFVIERSAEADQADIHIPPDYFVCDDCLREMLDPAERRFRYPFINCTQCGPRYTLIDRLPYDRPNTSMAAFPLCGECLKEYKDPLDRRYHAQPLACARCGPSLTFSGSGFPETSGNENALASCLNALREGCIVAVKGVGGYHLLCDASGQGPIETLRLRKRRPHKPLAVLIPWNGADGLEWAGRVAELSDAEKRLLNSPARPIVLLRKRNNAYLHRDIAPGLNEIGLMLPYSPLHHLLADGYGAPLVATSGNLSGEPVLTDHDEAARRLDKIADAFLHHNRPIRRPADDSVYRCQSGKPRPLRIGRGMAPLERTLPFSVKQPMLAVGADLKNTVALAFENRIVVSPHIGNHGTMRSEQVFEQVIADLCRLYAVEPEIVVCDAHPGYYSSLWAERRRQPIRKVFHHHAHASALAGEYVLDGETLVFTWDGTGYGEDGTIWGGEALLGSPGRWQRVASLRPFSLPGGDKAGREPWRCALAVCWEDGLEWPDCPEDNRLLRRAWEQGINCPRSSSAGRLFDAAAALIGVSYYASYEGHAAMQLEAVSGMGGKMVSTPLGETSEGLLLSDWAPLLPRLLDKSISPKERASLFHTSMAGIIVDQAVAVRDKYAVNRVGLTGGVFHNRLLSDQLLDALLQRGFQVIMHEALPAGDGGISFGQIVEVENMVK